MIDTQAEREGTAIDNAYRPRTTDFGKRLHKTKYAPADVVHHRKRTRNRNSRQVNLQTLRIRERLENPEKYKAYRKPVLGVKTMTTAQVKRTIDGKQVTLTPTENFIHSAGYRVDMIADQLERLGKQKGKNYEYTEEHVEAIQDHLLELVGKAVETLKAPAGKKAVSAGFAAKLKKV